MLLYELLALTLQLSAVRKLLHGVNTIMDQKFVGNKKDGRHLVSNKMVKLAITILRAIFSSMC